MRTFLLVLGLFLCFSLHLSGQKWSWAEQFTASGDVSTVHVQADANNHVYMAGTWGGGGPLTVQAQNLNSYGSQDAFLAKFDDNGDILWIIGCGGADDDEIGGFRIHNSGHIYVVGAFKGASVTIESTNPAENVVLTNSTSGKWEPFVAKYRPDGTLVWAKRLFWGNNNDRLQDIDFKDDLMIIIGNYKSDPFYYDDGGAGGTLSFTGDKNLFIAKYDTSATFQAISRFIPTIKQSAFKRVHPCLFGGYYITGDILGELQDDGETTLFSTSTGDVNYMDIMLMRVDDNLDYLWGRTAGGSAYDHVNSSTVSKYGNLYVSGKTESNPVVFDSTATLSAEPLPSLGSTDFYICKYSASGILQWVRREGTPYADNAYGLAIFQEMVQFAGMYADELVINQDTLRSSGPTDVNTGFAIFDRNGNPVGGQGIGGTEHDEGQGVAYDRNGQTLIIGRSRSNPLEIGEFSLSNPNPTMYMGFVAHYEYAFSVAVSHKQDVTCNGGSDGEIIVTPYFGVYPFTYQWSHDAMLNDSIASGLTAGDYTVTVKDARDSTEVVNIEILEPEPVNIAYTITDVSCYGGSDGAIDVTVSGGVSPYTYAWTGEGVSAEAEDQTGLTAGDYSLTVTDDQGCTGIENFTINEPLPITFDGTTKTDIVLPAGCNGAIDLQVNGGTPDYVYDWTGPSGFTLTDEDLTNLCDAGNYSVTVTDANGCTGDTTITIDDGYLFFAYICEQNDVACYGGNDGYARVCTENAVGNLTYEWITVPGGLVVSTTHELLDAPAGTYSVTVTDDGTPPGSPSTVQVTIDEPSSLPLITYNKTDVTCYGACNGGIDLTMVSGGTPPYTYAWVGPSGFTSTSKDVAGLCPGNYSVTVTDANGCTAEVTNIPIDQPQVISCNLTSTVNNPCYGDLDGELTVAVSGGTGLLSVQWDDPASQTTLTARFLEAGNYRVTVTDENGCSRQFGPYTITEPPAIQYTSVLDHVDCFGDCNGSIVMTVSGGTTPFNYEWYDGGGSLAGTSKNLTGACAGDYTLVITDANNCIETYDGTITEPAELVFISEDFADPVCAGECTGTITLSAGGGTLPYEYSVDDGATWQTSGEFTELCSGNYPVKVKDANGCETSGSILSLTDPLGITISTVNVTDISCHGEADGAISITASGRDPLEYSIDGGSTWVLTNEFSDLTSGDYDVMVRDVIGCEEDGGTHTVSEPAELVLGDPVVDGNTITITATGGTEPYTFILKTGPETLASNNTGVFAGLASGTYQVEVNDINGCGPVLSEDILVEEFEVFDAITPNGDGSNDTWVIHGLWEYPEVVVKIFNAWGNLVYESEPGYPEPWDGRSNGKELPSGTYFYIIDLYGDGNEILKGTVSIIK